MPQDPIWEEIEAALALPEEQRRSSLAERLRGKALDRAVAILDDLVSADGWFDGLANGLQSARHHAVRQHEAEVFPLPESIGAYRLTCRVGGGGMGDVVRAERADGAFAQTVAIKLLRPGLSDEISRERFRAERQILAGLEHPNIARLIDGGVTDEGRLYLVMEWVEGEPIDRFVRRARLDVRQTIELFLEVCNAVDHAHRNLVIHRDLKPSNILVSNEGRVKLVDFGIAKILVDSSAINKSVLPRTETEASERSRAPLTPRYAAPEQLAGQAATVATDVYSLGLVLFELLTGRSPFASEPTGAPQGTFVGAPSAAIEKHGAPEGIHPRQVRGDLDAIVAAATRSEPRDRTNSVREVREDLQLHLARRPIRARKQTVGLRFHRWIRRNQAAAVIGILALVTLAWGATRLIDQYRETVRERDKAQTVSALLVDLFRSADPLQPQRSPPGADEILERGRDQLQRLSAQPALQASLADVLGEVHRNVGLHAEAIELHRQALAIYREGEGERRDMVKSLALQADAFRLAGDLDSALAVATEALEQHDSVDRTDSLERARLLSLVGRIYLSRRELDQGEERLRRARAIQDREALADDLDHATTLNDLAVLHLLRGEAAAAEPLLRQAIAIRSERLGADHMSLASLENNLAALLSGRAEFAEAEEIYRRLVPLLQQRLGPGHVHSLNAQRNLGLALLQQGHESRALEQLQAALLQAESSLPPTHALSAVLTNYVGFALLELGQLDAAEQTLRTSLEMARAAFSSNDPRQASAVNNLALLAERRGDLVRAERGFVEALEVSRSQLLDSHPQILAIQSNLARIETAKGELEAARRLYAETLAKQRDSLPPKHPDLAYTLLGLARCHRDLGNPALARPLAAEALALRRDGLPANHRLLIEAELLAAELGASS